MSIVVLPFVGDVCSPYNLENYQNRVEWKFLLFLFFVVVVVVVQTSLISGEVSRVNKSILPNTWCWFALNDRVIPTQ